MIAWFTNWIKRSPLVAYFVLVFGIEWLLVLLLSSLVSPLIALLIGSWLPNLVGVFVTGVAGGREGLRGLLGKVVLWRIGLKWYVIALLLPTALAFLTVGLCTFFGNDAAGFASASQLPQIFLMCVITGALGEELGWRGTALPRLQARWNPLISSLILGVLWGIYHLPAFFLSGLPLVEAPLIPFMLACIGLTIIVSWTFNRTGGSLIPVFLYHFAFNFTGNATGVFNNPTQFSLLGVIILAVAVAIAALDWNRFTRPASAPAEGVWMIR